MSTEYWRASELATLETRPIWRKRVVIFGRSIPIVGILLAITAVAALAWGLYIALAGTGEVVIGYQSPPVQIPLNISAVLNNENGTVGSVVSQPTVDMVANTINGGEFAGLNETSWWSLSITAENLTVDSPPVTFDVPLPSTLCWDVSYVAGRESPFVITAMAIDDTKLMFKGNAGTFACAGAGTNLDFTYSATP